MYTYIPDHSHVKVRTQEEKCNRYTDWIVYLVQRLYMLWKRETTKSSYLMTWHCSVPRLLGAPQLQIQVSRCAPILKDNNINCVVEVDISLIFFLSLSLLHFLSLSFNLCLSIFFPQYICLYLFLTHTHFFFQFAYIGTIDILTLIYRWLAITS